MSKNSSQAVPPVFEDYLSALFAQLRNSFFLHAMLEALVHSVNFDVLSPCLGPSNHKGDLVHQRLQPARAKQFSLACVLKETLARNTHRGGWQTRPIFILNVITARFVAHLGTPQQQLVCRTV